jgi:hypothetical protein
MVIPVIIRIQPMLQRNLVYMAATRGKPLAPTGAVHRRARPANLTPQVTACNSNALFWSCCRTK